MISPDGKFFDYAAHKLSLDKIVIKRFSQAFMSNSKWKKCFEILHHFDEEEPREYGRRCRVLQAKWKFINKDLTFVYTTPDRDSLWRDTCEFWFGREFYNAIEWLEVLKIAKPYGTEQYPTTHYTQDLESVKTALSVVGKWEMEETESGLKIYGYK